MHVAAVLAAGAIAATGGPGTLPQHGALLRGDLDGDGQPDTAAVRCRPGPASFLILSTRRETLTRQLPTGCGVAVQVVALAPIDRVPGAEIVVSLGSGSVDFAGIYTLRRGTLVRMKINGTTDDEFRYYGAVAHDAGADCVRPASGEVVFSRWRLGERGWGDVERTYMRVVGTRLRLVRTKSFHATEDHRRYGGFDSPQPFPSCAVARAPGYPRTASGRITISTTS